MKNKFLYIGLIIAFVIIAVPIGISYSFENIRIIEKASFDTLDMDFEFIPHYNESGDTSKIHITFLNPTTGKMQEHVDYSVNILDSNNEVIFSTGKLIHTSKGEVNIPVTFKEDGWHKTTVTIQGVLFQPIDTEEVVLYNMVANEQDRKEKYFDFKFPFDLN